MTDAFGFIAAIIMAGATFWVLGRMRRMSGQRKAKDTPQSHFERAVWAWAKVVNSNQEGVDLGGMVRVMLVLDIHLPGTPPYTSTTTWLVEQEMLKYIETGKDISLKVDPQNLKYVYPSGSWAKVVE
jgi:hypothetical protein